MDQFFDPATAVAGGQRTFVRTVVHVYRQWHFGLIDDVPLLSLGVSSIGSNPGEIGVQADWRAPLELILR